MEKRIEFGRSLLIASGVLVAGLVSTGYGIWRVVRPVEPVVEIVREEKGVESDSNMLVVDVGGAVERPGVYEVPQGSRIGAALILAGGLGVEADREWVGRYLNLAEEVKDGSKIFIPGESGQQVANSNAGSATNTSSININTASVAELDSLWGIGEARANTIIANRPYSLVEELVTKAKLPENVYDAIKDQVTIY